MIRYRVYYGDGTTYEGSPWDAPPVNVQIVMQEAPNERGFILIHGKDQYCWFGDDFGWQGTDQAGFYDYLMNTVGPQRVLFGRTLHDEVYQQLCRRAVNEPL